MVEFTNKKTQGSRLDQKPNQTMYCLQETTYTLRRQKQTQSKRVENDSPSKEQPQIDKCSHTYTYKNKFQGDKTQR